VLSILCENETLRGSARVFLGFCLLAATSLGGCRPPKASSESARGPSAWWTIGKDDARAGLYRRFQSEDPSVRMAAVLQVGRQKDRKSAPYLVDRLTDAEAEVRFAAIFALQRITGTTRGYRYYESSARRGEAVQRWRAWLAGRPESQPASQPASRPASQPASRPASRPAKGGGP